MKRGFTLIELLVVIAIIGVLSSVVLASLNSARTKANDAKTRSDLHQISVALEFYYDKFGSYPPNPTPSSGVPISSALPTLVTNGFIASLPTSPNPDYQYSYYNYGPGNPYGAMVVAYFLGAPPATTAGYPGSCRPFASGTNWCDQTLNNYYCLCHPH